MQLAWGCFWVLRVGDNYTAVRWTLHLGLGECQDWNLSSKPNLEQVSLYRCLVLLICEMECEYHLFCISHPAPIRFKIR